MGYPIWEIPFQQLVWKADLDCCRNFDNSLGGKFGYVFAADCDTRRTGIVSVIIGIWYQKIVGGTYREELWKRRK